MGRVYFFYKRPQNIKLRGNKDIKSGTSEISQHLNIMEGKVATFSVPACYKHLPLLPERMISKTFRNTIISLMEEVATSITSRGYHDSGYDQEP